MILGTNARKKIYTASITDATSLIDEKKTPFHLYNVDVHDGFSSWRLPKKLDDFEHLRESLQKYKYTIAPVPGPLNDSNKEFQILLNNWLQVLIRNKDIADSPELIQFLSKPNVPSTSSPSGGNRSIGTNIGSSPSLTSSNTSNRLSLSNQNKNLPSQAINIGTNTDLKNVTETKGKPQPIQHDNTNTVHPKASATNVTSNTGEHSPPSNTGVITEVGTPTVASEVLGGYRTVGSGTQSHPYRIHHGSASHTAHGHAHSIRLKDFVLLKVIGKGSFGKVMLVRKIDNQKIYAMKVLAKENVIKRNQVEHTKTERSVLEKISHPFIVSLRYAFQTKKKLYFVLDYCPGGELFFHLGRAGRFSENRAKFYAAQITLALEYLHGMGIVYRDLKPENVLLDGDGHIALTDFGLSKEGISDNVSAHSFCGTPEYLAPEILTRAGHGRAADWWSLGALLYEMLTGMPPFYSRNRDRLFHKILKAELRIPRFFSNEAKSILLGLLERNAAIRLGSTNDAEEVKSHRFFSGVDWNKILHRQIPPPFKPNVALLTDTNNFDQEFTNMPLSVEPSLGKSMLSENSVSDGRFVGFTYVNPEHVQTIQFPKRNSSKTSQVTSNTSASASTTTTTTTTATATATATATTTATATATVTTTTTSSTTTNASMEKKEVKKV